MPKFEPHGSIYAYWKGRVLVFMPSGEINIETVNHSKAELDATLSQSPSGAWCRLERFANDNVLPTPESVLHLEQSLMENKENGCVCVGIVGGNVVISLLFEKLCKKAGLEFATFNSYSDGLESLAARAMQG